LREAQALATTDALTGLVNRRGFHQEMSRQVSFSLRHAEPFGLLAADIDHFKSVNDRYGHLEGDRVLREVARRTIHVLRKSDQAFRLGGEEFAMILRGTDMSRSVMAADRLVEAIKGAPFRLSNGEFVSVTMSVGVAAVDAANAFRVDDLQGRADRALYAAKHSGRNRVVRESPQHR
jgi:diguanylate cyclase (GGDEF)-like protein